MGVTPQATGTEGISAEDGQELNEKFTYCTGRLIVTSAQNTLGSQAYSLQAEIWKILRGIKPGQEKRSQDINSQGPLTKEPQQVCSETYPEALPWTSPAQMPRASNQLPSTPFLSTH